MFNKLAARSQKISPGLRKIIGNSSWLLADRILRMGVGLFVGVWVARYLGPQQFGLYNYAVAFVSLFSAFATLGLDGIVVRDIVRDPACKEETLGTALALKLIGGFVTLLVTFGTISLLRPDDNLTRWLVGLTAAGMIFQAFDIIDFWFQSQVQSKYTVYAKNVAFILSACFKVLLIKIHAPLIAFAFVGLAEFVIGAVGLVIAYKVNGQYFKTWKMSFQRARNLLKDTWPLILSGLAVMIYMRIDQIMLGNMVGDEAVGIYSAATRISEVWYFLPTAIVTSTFPSIIEAKKISQELYYQRLQKVFNLLSASAYTIAIPLTFLSSWIVVQLFGKTYINAGPVLAIHIWSAIFVFLGVASSSWVTVEGLFGKSLVATLVGATVNIILNGFLIPTYSALGAAISTLISYGIASYLMSYFIFKGTPIFKMQTQAINIFTLIYK